MTITFKPLQESHFPLLLKWLEAPHVKPWWDPEVCWTKDLIEQKYQSYVQGYKRLNLPDRMIEKPIHAFIIDIDGKEVGYIQYYNAYDFPREQGYEIEGLPKSLASLDIFIGAEDFLNKGLGALVLKKFLKDHIDPHYKACFVDPDGANLKAIHIYEKVGFKTIKEGPILWMVRAG